MQDKIAFEEHVATNDTIEATRAFSGDSNRWDDHVREILDVGDERLEHMDRAGIRYAILSLNAPGVQAIPDPDRAVDIARRANEKLAAAVQTHPDRYGAFAALPMQDPDAAARELQHCVHDLGFKGALLNGFTQRFTEDSALYYDLPEFEDFWSTVAELRVPIYLHPRMQIPAQARNYDGHPWLMSAPWGFAVETSIHALRLCGSGIFDRFPGLRIILGHLGEFIPFGLWRIDARMRYSARGYRGARPLGDYFRDHFLVTTSGFFHLRSDCRLSR